MLIRLVDHSFILLHLRQLAHIHTECFRRSEVWQERWTDYPTPGHEDSLSYLIDVAARDSYWVVAVDDDGSMLGERDRVLACGIVERLDSDHAADLGIDIRGREGKVFYNVVYFHDPAAGGQGLAHALMERRIYLVEELGGRELWTRTHRDHPGMDRILRQFGFEPMSEQVVEQAGVASVRVRYRKLITSRSA